MLSKSILGVNMLKIADNRPQIIQKSLKEVVGLFKQNELKVISGGVFNYTEIAKAHRLLEEGKSVGKISVKW
jgi:NADPH2:quinone reductase